MIRRFIDDRQACNRLGATESCSIAPDQKKINESKTKKPTDEGWLFALALLPEVFTAQTTKPISLNYFQHCCCDPSFVFWGTSKAVRPEKVFGG
jgi:hypothetical protein